MKYTLLSNWDMQDLSQPENMDFVHEIIRLDRANRRKRRALRQMNKAIERNKYIDELEDTIIDLQNQLDREVDNELMGRDNELEADLWKGW